jgi:hypothetical protein
MSTENIENVENNSQNNTKDNNDQNDDLKKRNRIIKSFIKTFREFINDIKSAYPEYREVLEKYKFNLNDYDINSLIVDHFMMSIQPFLIEISDKNESIFQNEKERIVIFKDVDFNKIWEKSNEMNKEIIWKYLHTLIIIGNNYNGIVKKDGIFKQFNEMLSQSELDDESLNHISDQAKAMLNMVKSLSEENENQNQNGDENNSEKLSGGMFENTKIGEIAKELASEINFEEFSEGLGSLGESDNPDPSKLFDNLIGKDPMKLMGLIQNVGSKIQDKISNGQINEQELVSEAQNMMQGLQDNPLFKGMNGEGINSVFGSGLSSSLFGEGGKEDEEDIDDLDKDINKENSESSSFNPDNIRKMGFDSLFSKLGGGSSNNNNPMGNIGDMMSQMMSDPGMQQMMQQMAQDPSMQQMAQQMQQGNGMGNMNDMMSQMLNNPNMQQMAQQMASNPNMQQMAQQMNNNQKSKVRVDNNKLRNMSTRERLKKKLEKRKKEQEENLYKEK